MRQSQLFTKTRREAPKDEVAKNAQFLIRAGYVHKEMAGVYSYLPLGVRTLRNIERIIREEMSAIHGQEIVMTALQDKVLWEKTDRWDDKKVDNWFKTAFKSGGETGLGITHEEPLTRIMTGFVSSYRDLPIYVYQFQTKFRNELRAKSGIIRGKEFLMKDLYSFSRNEEEHRAFYEEAREAYKKIFQKIGIGDLTHTVFASGGIFSKYSEEFQTISDAGEDVIYIDEASGKAVNKEVMNDEVLEDLGLTRASLVEKKAIEVGNIFNLGTTFSKPFGLSYKDEGGKVQPVIMGSYGLGLTRLMGTIVEVLSDERGIVWPESVAPFTVHLIALGGVSGDEAYRTLQAKGVPVLYDDRNVSAGEKFADADLLGIPWRIVVSGKTGNEVEVKSRSEEEIRHMPLASFLKNQRLI